MRLADPTRRPRRAPTAEIDRGLTERVRTVGLAAGLDAVGFAEARRLTRARAVLHARRDAGLGAGMGFTMKNPDRSTDPGRLLRHARSLVVGARDYRLADVEPPQDAGGARPHGRVARYACVDHYAPLRAALGAVADTLRAAGHRAAVFADDNALVDREAAWMAGLGWYGKNANLLLPSAGSWFVLGAVVTDARLEPAAAPEPDGCGPCRRCLDGCPTGAIVAPGVVDAGRCLAWLLQAPGVFPAAWREALGDRIYGCDDCQEVCPPNRRRGPVADDPAPGGERQDHIDLLGLLAASDAEVIERHGRFYLWERDPRYLRRDALVALGNTADGAAPAVAGALAAVLGSDDALLVAHAVWAARRLGRDDLLGHVRPAVAADPVVADELRAEVRPRDHAPGVARVQPQGPRGPRDPGADGS